MPNATSASSYSTALFADFFFLVRDYGVPVSPKDLIDLNEGFDRGLVRTLDDLFVLSKLTFVRRKEHLDAFERAFSYYFFGIEIPHVAEGDLDLLRTKPFKDWLAQQIADGKLPERAIYTMSAQELMDKFWETLREQLEAHQGGSKWVGRFGNSPFGSDGNAQRGVRVEGAKRNRSALTVIADRRYLSYADKTAVRAENIREALESMKHMKNEGPRDILNLDETIRRTAQNGGEIDLVFERELRDRISVVLLVDNGGYSMDPFIQLTRLLFKKMHERFEDMTTYYFHNTIYQNVYTDFRRTKKLSTEQLLQRNPDTRIVFFGDATMAPEELEMPHGSIYHYAREAKPSTYWLRRVAERYKHSVWLNPIPKTSWPNAYGGYTLNRIRQIFHMEDMTLGGIKGMVERLSEVRT
ncbi:MAG: hypothetical protein IT367_18255 [Candidatus Hydrogenedentes bacterium]|nr:hypothetical protein [Candidatus Hydrogenedentota bacterium]